MYEITIIVKNTLNLGLTINNKSNNIVSNGNRYIIELGTILNTNNVAIVSNIIDLYLFFSNISLL